MNNKKLIELGFDRALSVVSVMEHMINRGDSSLELLAVLKQYEKSLTKDKEFYAR